MNLYLLAQYENRGYNTYDYCVVCAPNEEQAKSVHPRGDRWYVEGAGWIWSEYPVLRRSDSTGWVNPDRVIATLIGTATPGLNAGVVMSSFRAG